MSDKSTLVKICNEILAWEQQREENEATREAQAKHISQLVERIDFLETLGLAKIYGSLADTMKIQFLTENWEKLTLEKLESLIKP